jgi:type II secretory pathway pseudopilin PulG
MSIKSLRNSRGDTIVEVVISIALIGTVLAGAYATANNSLITIRDAQEHEEATTLAESQLEVLGTLPTTYLSEVEALPVPTFCLYTPETFPTSGSIPADSPVTGVNYGTYCTAQGAQASDRLYTISIVQVTAVNAGVSPPIYIPTFRINVTWNRLGGGNDNVEMYYQPNPEDTAS